MSVSGITETLQCLTFKLGEEVFALDVAKVREILELPAITRVPRSPEFMRGVINLRGSVVPVIDMRLMFDMTRGKETVDTCIVVVEVDLEGEALVVGALADSVQEVVELEPERIEPAPAMGTILNTEYIRGLFQLEGGFAVILDIDTLFSYVDLTGPNHVG